MRKLLANPLLWRGGGGWPGSSRQAFVASCAFSVLVLGPWLLGACGCTCFEFGAVGLVLAASLLGGTSVYGAITSEREKKTLDSLRLTQLTPSQVVLGKLLGEFAALGRLLLAAAPALAALALLAGVGLEPFLLTLLVAGLAGLFGSVSGIFLSSLASTTSQAVLGGWVFKGVWLLGTPILDMVARAVFVQRDPVPLFTAANPLAALTLATLPEAAFGAYRWMVPLYVLASTLSCLVMFWLAARRIAHDSSGSQGIGDGAVHATWRNGWGPAWLQALLPGLVRNASFLREVTWQSRTGAGSWPGYLVYLVLFLAPFLYARAWALQNPEGPEVQPPPALEVSTLAPANLPVPAGSTPATGAPGEVVYATVPGQPTVLVLVGHRPASCLRLALYRELGVPLPADSVRAVESPDPWGDLAGSGPAGTLPESGWKTLDQVDPKVLGDFGMVAQAPPPPADGSGPPPAGGALQRALHVGLTGTLLLFLLYLAIRSTGFLAGALTGEKDRRSWQDLALTGIPAGQVVSGKLWGALVHPLLQMTVVFPVLSLYVFPGLLTPLELGALYLYSVALALGCGLLGLWCSAWSPSTHASQGRAVGLVLVAFLGGFLTGSSWVPFLVAGGLSLLAAFRGSRTWQGWALMALGLALAPQALSPLASVASFLPSLVEARLLGPAPGLAGFAGGLLFLVGASLFFSRSTLERVVDRHEGVALRAEPD